MNDLRESTHTFEPHSPQRRTESGVKFASIGNQMEDGLALCVCAGFLEPADKAAHVFLPKLCLAERRQFPPDSTLMAGDIVGSGSAVWPKRGRVQVDAVAVAVDGPVQTREVDEDPRSGFVSFATAVEVWLCVHPSDLSVEQFAEFIGQPALLTSGHLLRQRQKSLGGQTFERWVDLGNHFAEREREISHSLAVSSEKNFFSVSICAVTLVFDREGYSPSFFAEMKTKRIAILSYHKFPGEPWPQSNGAKRSRP